MGLAFSLLGAACSDGGDDGASTTTTEEAADGLSASVAAGSGGAALALSGEDARAVVATYADVAFALYSDAVTGAEAMRTSIQALVGTPSEATLAAARQSWVAAREVYVQTEAFRSYGGPIDHPDHGPDLRLSSGLADVAHLDYTVDPPASGIVNDVVNVPEITLDALLAADHRGDGADVLTGWHAIEFLLWGEDLSDEGPGARPATDFHTAPNADRRGTYLMLLADLVLFDLTSVRDRWAPDGGHRSELLVDPGLGVGYVLQGMGALSAGDLGGRHLSVAYGSRDQEDERSRFSDNTHNDIVGNLRSVRIAYTAEYGEVAGTSLSDVVTVLAPEVDADLRKQLDNNVAAALALPVPFDQLIAGDDDDPGRAELAELIDDLRAQGGAIASLASRLGLEISIEG